MLFVWLMEQRLRYPGQVIQLFKPEHGVEKKQNSLNFMFITKLNGEIIFYSPLQVGAHDQSHWNELELRETILGKVYGIMGDGGFMFNWKDDESII